MMATESRKRQADAEPNIDVKTSDDGLSPEGINPPRKKRRMTAVGRTTNRASIKLIESNAINSPLLALPGEIRETILGYLLGNKFIHVKFRLVMLERDQNFRAFQFWGEKPARLHRFEFGDALYHHVCDGKSNVQDATPDDASVHGDLLTTDHLCHHECMNPCSKHGCCDTTTRHFTTLSLSVLQTCRQFYEEAHHVLWTTNTFVFDDAYSLPFFLTRLNSVQRRKLTNLCVQPLVQYSPLRRPTRKGVDLGTIKMLQDLKNFNLDIHYRVNKPGSSEAEAARSQALKLFKNFKALSVKNATVTLAQCTPDRLYGGRLESMTAEDKKDADEFRVAMLNPQAATVLQQQREADKQQSRIWTEKQIHDGLERTKRIAAQVKRNATWAIEHANKLDRKAKGLESQVERKGSKVGMTLDFNARHARNRADQARLNSDRAKEGVERWEKAEANKIALTDRRLMKLKADQAKARHEGGGKTAENSENLGFEDQAVDFNDDALLPVASAGEELPSEEDKDTTEVDVEEMDDEDTGMPESMEVSSSSEPDNENE